MRVFVFIVLVLISSLIGCRQTQPIIETKTIIDTAFIEIPNKDAILDFIECDSNYNALWLTNVDLSNKLYDICQENDSIKSISAKIIVKKVHKHTVDTIYKGVIIPQKEKVVTVYRTPAWAYIILIIMFMFIICFLITLFLLIKQINHGTDKANKPSKAWWR